MFHQAITLLGKDKKVCFFLFEYIIAKKDGLVNDEKDICERKGLLSEIKESLI